MFAEDGNISSKRVVGFGAFLLVAICVICALFKAPRLVPEFMWTGLLLLIATCFGLNTFLQSKAMNVKSKAVSDVAQDSGDANEILNSPKPSA